MQSYTIIDMPHRVLNILSILYMVSFCIDAIGSDHQQILNWWQKVSLQKPLKCKINPSYLEPIHQIAMNLTTSWDSIKLLKSRPCTMNDNGKTYLIHHFKGKTVNNMFEGV